MKKVIKEHCREEAQYYCDKHPDRECFSELKTISWYGSKHDLTGLEIHLCDECLDEIIKMAKEKFNIDPIDLDI